MDYTMRMVYETEGRRGADERGWNGEEARQEADREDWGEYCREMAHRYEQSLEDILQSNVRRLMSEIMPVVMKRVPGAWRSKPRSYGAYKRSVIRKIKEAGDSP